MKSRITIYKFLTCNTLLFVFLFLAFQLQLGAQVSLQTSLDSNRVELATPFVLKVKVSFDPALSPPMPDLTPLAVNEKDLEVLGVKAWDTLVSPHATYISTEVQLAVYDTGTVMIPALQLIYKDKSSRDTARSEPLFIRILPPGQLTEDILPIKDLERIPESNLPYIYLGLAILLLLFFGWLTWRAFKRKKVADQREPVQVEEVLSPKERALNSINQLYEPEPGNQPAVKQYYSAITQILKTFIQEEHKFQVLDQTSESFLKSLHAKFGQEVSHTMRYLFEAADMIKFAKADAESDMIRQAKGIAVEFVHKTAKQSENGIS